jgi:putative transposase
MSWRGDPYDNTVASSFIKTLNYEEMHPNDYESSADAYASIVKRVRSTIERFLDDVYNHKRQHSALGYRPPVECEQALLHPPP